MAVREGIRKRRSYECKFGVKFDKLSYSKYPLCLTLDVGSAEGSGVRGDSVG